MSTGAAPSIWAGARVCFRTTKPAVVATSDDLVADQILAASDDEGLAGEFAVGFEQDSCPVVEGASGGVRAGDHRVGRSVTSRRVPVGDHRIERLPRRC